MQKTGRVKKMGIIPLEKRLMLDASLSVISGQILWLDAKDATTIIDADGDNAATGTGGAGDGFAGTVATWQDKSGYSNNVTQSTATNRPTYNATTLNGSPVLGFDGVNDVLFRPDTSASLDVTNNGLTVIAVTRATNAAGSPMIVNKENSYEMAIQGSKIQGAIETSAVGGWVWAGTTAIDTAWHMVGFQHANTTWSFFKDANLTETVAAGNGQTGNISNTAGNFNVGARGLASPTSQFFGGSMAEILIYNRTLTSDEMQDVENYLATKWGFAITDTAPVISTNVGRTLSASDSGVITNAHLAATDTDNSESILKYTLSSATTHGSLTNTNTGLTLGLGDTFTQADINSGYIIYTHDGTFNFSDSFSFTVTDGYATTAVSTFDINLIHTNSAPNISGQVLWLDAADAATILDADGDNAGTGTGGAGDGFSGSVNTWLDKSSSGFDVAAGSAAERPTYSLSAMNGNNVVTFDGGTDRLANLTASIGGDDFTTFIVFNRTTSVARDGVFEMGGGVSRNGWFINEAGNGKINYYLNGSFYNYTSAYVAGQYSLVSTVQNTNAIDLYLNGTNELSTTGGPRAPTTGIFVGDDSTSGDQLQGNIAEIIVYDRDLTAEERHDVEIYLAAKWMLSINNTAPAINVNAGETVNEGGSVAITAAALSSSDVDNSDTGLIYIVTNNLTHGTLTNTNTGLTFGVGDIFTQGDVDSGYIVYTHDGTENFADTFDFAVTDGYEITSSQTFNLTITPVNEAPTLSGWTLVSSENFESGATGWSDNTTTNGGTYLSTYLGRHSMEGGVQNTFKTYALSGTQDYITISFDFYRIDSWDAESFRIYVDDNLVYNVPFSTAYVSPADGSSGAVSWTIQETTQFLANFAHSGWTEQNFHFNMTVASTAASIKLGFSSTLNQAVNDEAWGVDNIIINEVGAGPATGPFVVSERSVNGDAFGKVSATDPDMADTLSYSIVGGTGAGVFAINASTGILTVSNAAALNYEVTTSYTLDVRVTDIGGLTDTRTVTVNVLDALENTAPVINALGPLSLAENATVGTTVGTVTSTDAEGNTVTYSITAGNTDNLFSINSGTGQITLSSITNLNYEWDNSYTLTIQAIDNGFGALSSTRNIVINIANISESPSFDPAQQLLALNPYLKYSATTGNFYRLVTTTTDMATATANAAAMTINGVGGYLATITSAAENAYLTGLITTATFIGGNDATVEGEWRWAGGADNGQMFWLGTSTGSSQNGYYTNWGVGEPNNSGNEDALQLLTSGKWNDILATSVLPYLVEWDGASVLASLGNGPYSLAENSAIGTSAGFAHASDPDTGDVLAYSITGGTGMGHFAINAATGEITLTDTAAANFELSSSYTLDLRVQDVAGLFDTTTVTINVTDVNETPVLDTNTGTTLNEGASVTITSAMISSSDVDTPPDTALVYAITSAVGHGTLTNTNTGLTLGLGDTFTQGDVDNGYITYVHDDTENFADAFSFTVSDGLITLPAATFNFTITPVNEAPTFSGTGPFTTVENVPLGTSIGSVTSSDSDTGDVLTYSITGGTGMGHFAINAATGAITLTDTAAANFELSPSYTLDLRVQDIAGLFDTTTVTINITDANDVPTMIGLSNAMVTENSSVGTIVGTLSTTDEDIADLHSYTLLSNPGNKFAIVGNELRVAGSIDYEATQHITIVLRTDDGNGATYDRSFVIAIGDEQDTFTPPPEGGGEGSSQNPSEGSGQNNGGLGQQSGSIVLDTVREGEFGQQSAFYGVNRLAQIIRTKTTEEIRSLYDKSRSIFETGSVKSDQQLVTSNLGERIKIESHYTNIRRVLEKIEEFTREEKFASRDSSPEREGDMSLAVHIPRPFNPIDNQFIDVMTYHEQKQERLRRVLMG